MGTAKKLQRQGVDSIRPNRFAINAHSNRIWNILLNSNHIYKICVWFRSEFLIESVNAIDGITFVCRNKKRDRMEMEIEHSLKYAIVNKTSGILKMSLQHLRFWNFEKKVKSLLKYTWYAYVLLGKSQYKANLYFVWVFFTQSFHIFLWMLRQCNRFSNIVFTW